MLTFILLSGVGTVLKWDVFWAFGKNILFPSSGWKAVGPGSSCVMCWHSDKEGGARAFPGREGGYEGKC